MRTVYSGQANVVSLPIAAKATGNPIISGTVNFYLVADNGTNAGKWYRGSDQTWQAAESIAGAATHKGDGHWQLSLASGVWTKNIQYLLYAKESGDLHILVENSVHCKGPTEKAMTAWMMGLARDKSGVPGTQEILDPDDGVTVIAEVKMNKSTPYRTVTIL